jgi:hypothetical protein
MRDQIELCFFIGYTGVAQAAFESACIDTATRLCGGCFVADGTGYWREGLERHAPRFHGPLKQEYTLCLKLTTELAKEKDVLAAMRAAIAAAADRNGLRGDIRWVHVQRHPIHGLHFSIEDELPQAA